MLKPLARIPIEQRALRNVSPDSAPISCFCCRDSALAIPWVVARYVIPGYSNLDAPLLCQRINCNANSTWIPTKEGGAEKRVDRYNGERLDLRLKPDQCEEIHRLERDRIARILSEEAQLRAMPDLSGVVKTMPDAPRPPSEQEIEQAKRRALATTHGETGEVDLWQ